MAQLANNDPLTDPFQVPTFKAFCYLDCSSFRQIRFLPPYRQRKRNCPTRYQRTVSAEKLLSDTEAQRKFKQERERRRRKKKGRDGNVIHGSL